MSSWPLVRLGDICEKITDGTHHSPANHAVGDFKYITAKNIKPWGLDLNDITYIDAITHREIYSRCDVRKDDLLYVKDGVNTGRVVVNPLDEEFSLLSSVAVLRAGPAIRPKYLAYALQESSTLDRMLADMAGVAITRLTLRKLNDAEIPLAPLDCQDRIVEKLEELLSDLDAGVAELKAAQSKLTRYRQSLLKAAVEGALTADWRVARAQSGEPQETGAALLQRFLTERRTRWETGQLAKFAELGKTPPQDWKSKYKEPVAPHINDLPVLPDGWTWASADQIIGAIETGKSFKCEERPPLPGEVGVVKVSAVSWGEYDEQESKTCRDPSRVNDDLMIRPGDFLFSRANTIELVGACVIATSTALSVMLSDKILRFVLVDEALKHWMLPVLRGESGRGQIEELASGNQDSMRNIGQERIRQIIVPLPPCEETAEIVHVLDAALASYSDQLHSIVHALKQSAAQRKNILKAAFTGQLVPQDPNDEPASALLERIRAERVSGGAKRSGKNGRKPMEQV